VQRCLARLSNLELVDRTKHQQGCPHGWLLIQDPSALAARTERQEKAFLQIV